MGLADRLRRLDDRVMPRTKTVRFDIAQPWWVTFGGLFGALFGLAVVWIPSLLSGTTRLAVFTVLVCLLIAYFIKVRTWQQRHRVSKLRLK